MLYVWKNTPFWCFFLGGGEINSYPFHLPEKYMYQKNSFCTWWPDVDEYWSVGQGHEESVVEVLDGCDGMAGSEGG